MLFYIIFGKKRFIFLYILCFFLFSLVLFGKIFLGESILIKKQTKYTNLKQNKGGGNRGKIGKIGDYLLY